GPPTANGRPGIHHVLARSFKDIILRYKTMQGYFVPRRAGWDTHGLPVELEVEKKLGFNSKNEIEKFGIAKFNQKCKESVWQYKKEWEELTERMGFWLDFKNAYITYENSYIESLWWIIKKFWEKGLLYEGHKVAPWCSRCGTTLSSHELGQPDAYKTITDNSVFIRFKIISQNQDFKNSAILSWTTTPWTLPGNVALAVNPHHTFVKIKDPYLENRFLILEEQSFKRLVLNDQIFPKDFKSEKIIKKFKAKDLLGLSYEPLFKVNFLQTENSYKVYPADFVGTEEGTGIVHTAVMYGEEDYELGKKVGLPTKHTVLENGQFVNEIEAVGGLFVISNKTKNLETENKIFDYLEKKELLFKILPYEHEYPHCWRCKTPILYYARNSWFVNVNKVRDKLIANNKKINWIPAHIKAGRFGQWLKEKKDWNFSRERYWGTPLPVWKCNNCNNKKVISSIKELTDLFEKSNNTYFIMRHGQSQTQIKNIIDCGAGNYKLTTLGQDMVLRQAKKLLSKKIDLIFSSDILRAKETAEIVSKVLGKEVIFDQRLRETNFGEFCGKPVELYKKAFLTYESRFELKPTNGESLRDTRKRVWEFLLELENKYKNKKILIISHEYPIWMIFQSALGWSEKQAILEKEKKEPDFIKTAEVKELKILPGPRNELGEFDLHRPYIDEIQFNCDKCQGKMQRVKEVVDVWFDSGAMPYAQSHWPFEKGHKYLANKKVPLGIDYPADYISEAVDQTRGWFYTLLAVSTLLGFEPAYKNVVCLGLVLDKYGKKMSKSIGNVVNPWEMIEKYGIDAVRWYLYSATPAGEPKNFDPDEILKTLRQVHLIAYNSFIFYKTYAVNKKILAPKKLHILDKWILNVLNKTILKTTESLNNYDIREAALSIENLIDNLSRWYIRRSRRRFQKPEDKLDFKAANWTLGWVLNNLAKLMAPFSPFFSEALYNETKIFDKNQFESVHLTFWPKAQKIDKKLLEDMELIRSLAAEALKQRAEAQIKVRQPLLELILNKKYKNILKNKKELLDILKDEANVKNIIFDFKQKENLKLNTVITPELYAEGILRDL
ncbi:MAG: class I tRNA ligase family protein, partial [Minisyncoccia bacterium]